MTDNRDNNRDRARLRQEEIAAGNEAQKYEIWLDEIDGVGRKTIRRLREKLGDETAEQLNKMREPALERLLAEVLEERYYRKQTELLLAARRRAPEKAAEELIKLGIRFVGIEWGSYPERLREIPDPPNALYVLGSLPDPDRPALAVVGARMASAYGREQARSYSLTASGAGIQIVSGMARGIDGIAGRCGMEAGGGSYAVLGCGAEICYPKENRDLYENLRSRGGVISEYRPGTMPEARLFPQRNRIISGLADALLVVEAKLSSGTLITADAALEQGREIFAIPGRVSDQLSQGCNELIRQGAQIATRPEDIIEFFFGVTNARPDSQDLEKAKRTAVRQILSDEEFAVYEELDRMELRQIDELLPGVCRRIGRIVPVQEVRLMLTKMILKSVVCEEGKGYYRRSR